MASYLIGLDCGGTRSRGVLADLEMNPIARATAGPGNLLSAGITVARRSYRQVITALLRKSNLSREEIVALGIGAAGAGRSAERRRIAGYLSRLLPSTRIVVDTDGAIALLGATGGGPGMIVIAGTGSIVLAMDRRGSQFRGGGWGPLLGDEGSGAAIGQEAIKAVLRSQDGRLPTTALTRAALSFFSVATPEDLVTRIHRKPPTPREYARLWPGVRDLAESGDPVARSILQKGGRDLAEMAEAVAGKLDLGRTRTPLVLAGGILSEDSLLRRTLLNRLKRSLPNFSLAPPHAPAEIGALILAQKAVRGDGAILRA